MQKARSSGVIIEPVEHITLVLGCRRWIHAYLTLNLLVAFALDVSVNQSKKGIVVASAYVRTRMQRGSALANQDATRGHILACKLLDPKTLSITIAPVTGTTYTFFMRQFVSPP